MLEQNMVVMQKGLAVYVSEKQQNKASHEVKICISSSHIYQKAWNLKRKLNKIYVASDQKPWG